MSPVTRWHVRPRCWSAATTPRASDLGGSKSATVATSLPSNATMTHVCPSLCVDVAHKISGRFEGNLYRASYMTVM